MDYQALITVLPAFNASCNSISFVFIILGYSAIRRLDILRHKQCMLMAFGFSLLFLVGYLTRYFLAGTTHFRGTGVFRTFYLTLLTSHMLLAIVNLPLIIASVTLGLRNRIEQHRRLVRFTLPIWLYVSSTGVLIYFLLYVWP